MQEGNAIEQIYRNAFLITRAAVASGFDRHRVREAAVALQAQPVDGNLPGWNRVACRPGCSHCCFAPAFGTPIDIVELARTIERTWSVDKKQALLERLGPYCDLLDANCQENFARFRSACPLLENDRCLAHDQRPVSCRGYASADAEICRLWKEEASHGYIIPRPNQEDTRSQAYAKGVADAFAQGGLRGDLVPMATALRDLLSGQVSPEEFLRDAGRWRPDTRPEWREESSPVEGSPQTVDAGKDERLTKLLEQMAFDPPAVYLSTLRSDATVDLLLRMVAPPAYLDVSEMQEARARIDQAVDDALDLSSWDAAEAYSHLPLLNTVRAGYSPAPMRPWMSKLGKLLCEKTAAKLAPDLLEPLGPRRPGKLRVGLASNNISSGSAASWSLGWVKAFDRRDFEVAVVNLDGEEDADSYRFKDAVDRYLHLKGDPLSIARRVRELDLDYLIYPDLGDGGWNFRFAIFRLARRQAAAWGCPFTSGLPTIDDYLSSDLMEPSDAADHYIENLVRLPNSGLTYAKVRTGMQHLDRPAFGLPEGHLIVLGQYFAKWLPQRDEMIAEISKRSENPLALIVFGGPYQQRVLRTRFEKLGVKVLPIPQLPLPLYLRVLELCDVTLDPPDFSGGHTTLMSLQLGTPVVTMPGEFMRSRQGLAFLGLANAPELVAKNDEEYIRLATEPAALAVASADLNPEPLFGDPAPVRALEDHIRKACV